MPDETFRGFIQNMVRVYITQPRARTKRDISPQRVTIIEKSFHGSFAVFETFRRAALQIQPSGNSHITVPTAFLLILPSRLGADPTDETTVEWAREFCARYARHSDTPLTQDAALRIAAKLYKAGVPLDYLREFHPTPEILHIPVDAIIAGWKNGLSPEYAREVLET